MKNASLTLPPVFDEAFRSQFEELLLWRRDVRRFRQDPLPEGLLDKLLVCADQAPSVGNSQPWRFVCVESKEARAAVLKNFETENRTALESYSDAEAGHYAQLKLAGLKEAPVHLAVFCDDKTLQGHGLGRATMPETLAYSVVGMIQTLWLSARAHGIGLGWVSILDPARLCADLEAEEGWQFIAYLCLGYPEEEHVDPELVRYGWQEKTDLEMRIFLK
ncbi:5,6-dimethylbenzimidazole synthase [Roseibium algae]|uniref:5,6-dimethylbenzimidazole synthase n=1 Tax=Roseibium algae TaxID=3123038 RepID=A0ABU8TEW7_9HYPH